MARAVVAHKYARACPLVRFTTTLHAALWLSLPSSQKLSLPSSQKLSVPSSQKLSLPSSQKPSQFIHPPERMEEAVRGRAVLPLRGGVSCKRRSSCVVSCAVCVRG